MKLVTSNVIFTFLLILTKDMTEKIKLILLFSGKRKCGKDFLTEKLMERFGDHRVQIVRISEPIKSAWAQKLNLDIKELLSDGPYKEKFRKDMIEWSDAVRKEDPGFFCREAMKKAEMEMIIVSDVRRKTDIKWFQATYGRERLKCIRIYADESVRQGRGWTFEQGVDDIQSECDLDDYFLWDMMCDNGDVSQTNTVLNELCDFVEKYYKTL